MLWLAAVVAVPLVVVPPDAALAHVSIPKITVFRVLAGLMAAALLVEWLVKPGDIRETIPRMRLSRVRSWLRDDPARWVLVALGVFAAATVAGTIASVSPGVSIWGNRPGSDGYGLYNMLAYAVLFAAIVTHLRSSAQVSRLFVAIAVVGTVVGIVSILQHFGLEPILEAGTYVRRSYSTLGNPIFAGAFLLMTIMVTATAGLMLYVSGRFRWALVLVLASLAVQLTGLLYTLSRGPWIGLAVAIAILAALSWLLQPSRQTAIYGSVVLLAVAAGIVFAVLVPQRSASAQTEQDTLDFAPADSIGSRVLSIYPEIAGGSLTGRIGYWNASIDLLFERPWSEVTPMRWAWARHVLGYGPDTFRYVIALRSPPKPTAVLTFEAHNYPLHVAVELGLLGFAALVFAGLAVTVVGAWRLLGSPSRTQGIILAGLMATFVGRGVEMMAGIPRASDTILLLALMALFVAVARNRGVFDQAASPPVEIEVADPPRRGRLSDWLWLIARAALVLVVVTSIGAVTVLRGVNHLRADMAARGALTHFNTGDSSAGVFQMLSAANLATSAPKYQLLLSRMFADLHEKARGEDARLRFAAGSHFYSREAVEINGLDPGARATQANAAMILAIEGDEGRFDEATRLFDDVRAMLPRIAVAHYSAVLAYLLNGETDEGLRRLDEGDMLFRESENLAVASESAFLRGLANRIDGDTAKAVAEFSRSLALDENGRYALTAHRHLAELYESLGDAARAAEHRAAVPVGPPPGSETPSEGQR